MKNVRINQAALKKAGDEAVERHVREVLNPALKKLAAEHQGWPAEEIRTALEERFEGLEGVDWSEFAKSIAEGRPVSFVGPSGPPPK